MSGNYITLRCAAETRFTERRSEFIGNASPVASESEALAFIADIKSRYSDAKHNVWAYVIKDNNITRFSDDGEPHGTAGLPVLDVLRKGGITDAAIVVTRYFGGILLGAGGLVRAYTRSASDAVEASGTMLIRLLSRVDVVMSYSDNSKCEQLLQSLPCRIADIEYGGDVRTHLLIAPSDIPELQRKLTDATSGRAIITDVGEEYGVL